jgi:hypothetical protein
MLRLGDPAHLHSEIVHSGNPERAPPKAGLSNGLAEQRMLALPGLRCPERRRRRPVSRYRQCSATHPAFAGARESSEPFCSDAMARFFLSLDDQRRLPKEDFILEASD